MQLITVKFFHFIQTNGVRAVSHVRALPSSILEVISHLGRLLQTSALAQLSVAVGVGVVVVVYYLFKRRRRDEVIRSLEESIRNLEEVSRFVEEMLRNRREVPQFDFTNISLSEAVNFWSALLPRGELSPIQIDLRLDQETDLTRFLNRLKATEEYQNLAARPTLAKRIYDVLKEMQGNEQFKETACLIINEGLSTCHDRIISALDELDLMMQIKKAEEKGEREELRKLGRGMLMLEEVQKAAKAHARNLISVDEIEVRLAFQIGLRNRLQLPLSTGHMIFRGCAYVSDGRIQEVGAEIEGRITDTKVEAYLQTWSPWQKLLRREAFDALEPEVVQAPEDLDWVCSVGTEELTEGYLYEGRLYSFENLKKIYIEKAIDPFTTLTIDLEKIKRVVKAGAECNL